MGLTDWKEFYASRPEAALQPAPANASSECSFKCGEILKTRRKPNHSHPEFEILLVLSGRGIRIIGDTLGEFRAGELYVVGSQLHHTFYPSPSDREPVKTLVIQFRPEAIRPALAVFPEFRGFEDLLVKARRGLHVLNGTCENVAAMMHRISAHSPLSPKRVSLFMAILAELGESDDLSVVGGPKLLPLRNGRMDAKLDIVCRLIQNNLANPLAQAALAGHLGMSPAAFSRWFKRHMGKPYTDYVNEARIGLVSLALAESDRDVLRISREFGFAEESHFHRLFKAIKGMSPTEYRRLSRLALPPAPPAHGVSSR